MTNLQGQSDTIVQSIDSNKIQLNLQGGLYSSFVWRGVKFGNHVPSAQALIAARYRFVEIGSYAAVPVNGTRVGYGHTLNHYI